MTKNHRKIGVKHTDTGAKRASMRGVKVLLVNDNKPNDATEIDPKEGRHGITCML